MAYLTIDRVVDQEMEVEETSRQLLGRCFELHERAMNALTRMIYWIPAADPLTDEGKVRIQARMWLHSAIHSFRSSQKLVMAGYYLEADIIGRHLIEVLVKMRYCHKRPDKLESLSSLVQKTAPIQFKTMFEEEMPGFYDEYKQSLSYPAHGGVGASAYRTQRDSSGNRTLDTGVVYKEFWATAFVNRENIFLLGYLRTYHRIFPELMAALPASEQQELNEVEVALEKAVQQHVTYAGGENSWHKATFSIWNF
jgi:hypothetical protein